MSHAGSLEAGSSKPRSFAALLTKHRRRDGRSQLSLSLDIGISSRHLGFLETGRSSPSLPMVLKLADAFDLAMIETNELLLSAGFAPRVGDLHDTALSTALGVSAFEAGVAIAGCLTVGEAQDIAARFLRSLGIDNYMTGTLRRSAGRWEIERDSGGNPAVGWLRHNQVHNYTDKDYLVRATAGATAGFFWSDTTREHLSSIECHILDEAREYRITNGFVMPVHMGDGSVRALSSWAEHIDTDVPTRLALGLVSSSLIERIIALGSPPLPANTPIRLDECYREVLGYVAAGYSSDTIGRRLTLPEEEVDRRIFEATCSLGCATPASAACRAIALEFI